MMKLTTTAVLITTLLSVVLLASSCEARGIRVHGKGSSSGNKKVNISLIRKWLESLDHA
jgi:hypothetical protein